MEERLHVRLYGRRVGDFVKCHGGFRFEYEQKWLDAAAAHEAHALSVSMPINEQVHGPERAVPFAAGLLPDDPAHRERIARQFDMYRASDWELLREVGRDCAGAVTVTDPDAPPPAAPPRLKKLDEAELAEALRLLPHRPLFIDKTLGTRLSLAGVHDKLAVTVLGGDVVCLPLNGFPSSHIIKTGIQSLPDSAKTEHFCLQLAASCGIATPKSSLHEAEDIVYLRINRYDRRVARSADGQMTLLRAHQEDFCQALGVHPTLKYEEDGGPGWSRSFELMAFVENTAAARVDLLDRAIFQYLSANNDAHAKNYSLRYAPNGAVGLSPLYDVNNQHAFDDILAGHRPSLAMAIGGEHDRSQVTRDHFKAFADEVGFAPSLVLKRLDAMAAKIATAVVSLRDKARHTIGDTPRLDRIVEDVAARAEAILHDQAPAPRASAPARPAGPRMGSGMS